MDIQKMMKDYKEQMQVSPKEENILDTIHKSKDIFYAREQERLLTYWEFLWTQQKFVQKKWWLFQILLLIFAWVTLSSMQEVFFVQRSMGVIGVLFVVLIIPELWKNKSSQCMEIEVSAYYSLRQVYATRILLFGVVDVLMITVFCGVLRGALQFTFLQLLSQFLFPMVITACICFGMLCNKYSVSETVSITFCIIWSAIWWLITTNEKMYSAITLPIWIVLLGSAIVFLCVIVCKTLKDCNECWEVDLSGIKDK